jgi:hypothetical protein
MIPNRESGVQNHPRAKDAVSVLPDADASMGGMGFLLFTVCTSLDASIPEGTGHDTEGPSGLSASTLYEYIEPSANAAARDTNTITPNEAAFISAPLY